ncbi:TetR/AcrR family transcriptional regulator [Klebsiella variicola subsp. variicola]|nr:TetR/AcrR family transcriptional regulator [Klebsiella variicola subsp. variicola]
MTRKKEIDKEKVLDAAESLILESGGRVFTLDAVAERAGISKGGLVYTFLSKDGLIHAVLVREVARFQKAVRQRLPAAPVGPIELILAHIEEALAEEDVSTQMAAFLITALVHASRHAGASPKSLPITPRSASFGERRVRCRAPRASCRGRRFFCSVGLAWQISLPTR